MSNIKGKFLNTDELELNISITMKLSDWKKLEETLEDKIPLMSERYKLIRAIRKAVSNSDKFINEEIT